MNQFLVKLNFIARKLHRFLVLFSAITFLVMAATGLLIRYRWFATETTTGSVFQFGSVLIRETAIRQLHSQYSLYFTMVIGLMMITGLTMYFLPKIIAKRNQLPQKFQK